MSQTVSYKNGITEGVIWKQLLAFFFPILLGTFFQQLYNTVDAVIVGNFVGKEALAAVGGSTGTLINLLVGFFTGLSSGATVIISQFYGARRDEQVSNAVHTAIALGLVASVVFFVVGFFGAPAALEAMDTPDDIMDYALVYIRTYFVGIVFPLIYNMGSGILRAIGDSRRPLYFLIICCLVNVVLDLLFVVGFDMGVFGAALATLLSQAVSAYLVVMTLLRIPNACRLIPRKIRFHSSILHSIILIGLPAGLQSVMYSLSNIIIQSSVNSFGTNSVAAWTAYGKIDAVFWMTINAFGISITTFVGQNFGAQKFDRVKKSVRICWWMALGASLAISGVILLFGQYILRLFTSDADVVQIGMEIIRQLVPLYFTYVCIEVFSGACRGAGDSLIPMIMTALGVCVLRVAWIFIAVPISPLLSTALMSYPITWATTSVLFLIYYCQGGWMRRRMAKMGFTKS